MVRQQSKSNINELLTSPIARDNRIDSIRGLMLVLIAINHYGGWLAEAVWQPLGFNSDAEGFIFISGYIFSIVYGRYLVDYSKLALKVLHRSFTVYKYHICLVILIPLAAFLVPAYHPYWLHTNPYYHNPSVLKCSIAAALLLFQPGFMDVLPIYSIFILMSWPFLVLLHRKKTFIALAGTFLLWASGQFVNPIIFFCDIFFPGASPGVFNIFSWQIVFMIGVYLGYKKKTGENIALLNNTFIKILLYSTFVILLLVRYDLRFNFIPFDINLYPYLDRTPFPWLRLLDFLATLFVVSEAIKKIPVEYGIPGIHFLGKHSLQVFSCHILFIYFVYIPLGFGEGIIKNYGNFAYILVLIISLLVMYGAAYIHKKYMDRQKKKKQA